jgi:AraC-like DNA-binding protein
MSIIAALLPSDADRDALHAAVPTNELLWAGSWKELHRIVRRKPVAAVVTDLRAESRKDGVLRVFRFSERFPLTPLVAWGELDGRELYRLGKAGASDVVIASDADDPSLVSGVLRSVLGQRLSIVLDTLLSGRLSDEPMRIMKHASDHVPSHIQVPELANAYAMSVSTLERRCERWGLPTPGRLLLWLRVLYGLRWLLEPGRSVESVAFQLGYSSGAAFRRAIKATVGGRPSPLRNPRGFERALDKFIAECPGDLAVQGVA